jgi:hypothetical protein
MKTCWLLSALLLLASASMAGGGGNVKVGYTFTDEDGEYVLSPETYNVYEGIGLSLTDFRFQTKGGLNFSANLEDITLKNRNLRFTSYKSGLFKLNVNHNRYRRRFDTDGSVYTRRQSSGVSATLTPIKQIKLFGGFSDIDKESRGLDLSSPVVYLPVPRADFTHRTFNAGAQGFCPYGSLRLEYRHSNFDDELAAANNRKADVIDVNAYSTVPGYDWIGLSGGFQYRNDEMDSSQVVLKTYQGWGGTKVYLPKNMTLNYRLLYARSKHEAMLRETDNYIHTLSLSKNWLRRGGFRIGYEMRIADDLLDRTESNGFLTGGWYAPMERLQARGEYRQRTREVKNGTTLVGDEDFSKYLVSLKYTCPKWGNLSARYTGRVKTNDDINSSVDYQVIASELNLLSKRYGRLNVAYSYYTGEYENRSDSVSYEFADHVLGVNVYPITFDKFTVVLGGTYYRSGRDRDLKKLHFRAGAQYEFVPGHLLEARYRAFDYEDLLVAGYDYKANIVDINVIKQLNL